MIFSETSNGQVLEIRQFEQYRWMNIGGSLLQSLMDIENQNQLLLPYTQAMLCAEIFCPQPDSILNFGLGSGCFERYFLKKFPSLKMTSVELSEEVISAAKRYFLMPEQAVVQRCSAENYLNSTAVFFDIILCDIFFKENHPASLFDTDFYLNISRALNKNGVLAINLSPDSEAELLKILLPIRKHFPWLSLLIVPDCTNIILFAAFKKPPDKSELRRQANQIQDGLSLNINKLINNINVLPRKVNN